jgi:Domain of unknown function (DUF4349)
MPDLDQTQTALAVIDATLAGDPVGPEHAELAELALILAGQREAPEPSFAARLDERVERRFMDRRSDAPVRPRSRRHWLYAPGAAVAAAAAVAVVVVINSGGSTSGPNLPVRASGGASAAGSRSFKAYSSTSSSPNTLYAPASPASKIAPAVGAPSAAGSVGALSPAAAPAGTGRKVVQSSQLSLTARPSRVDSVAQEVFNVVATQDGVVQSSNVTASPNSSGYAQFQLSVPSANLSQTMAALSRLPGATVASRTDATQDVTGQLGSDGRRLAEARALRSALLRQLAAATTTTAIASLKAQIRDVDAAISRYSSALNALQHQVDFSPISVTINAGTPPIYPVASGGSFTLHGAAHDAGRVLVVAAGVALIALAALVPVGLLVALGLWLAALLRRRRREQALDLI